MKRNTAGQAVGAQMINATTGAAFTSAVTVSVTGDAGTQATGSVGSGACTHEGNGYHTYAPAQAETNYDLAAFTFTGTGAIPTTVQIYTGFPQTGDNFARLGAPAGASTAADIAAVKAVLPAALVGGRMDSSVGAVASGAIAAAAFAANALDAVWSTAARVLTAGTNIQLPSNGLANVTAWTLLGNIPKTGAAIGRGTVTTGGTTTSIPTSAFSPSGAVADQFKNRVVLFDADTTTTALRGQACVISASSNSSTPTFTVSTLTTAPASGDTFSVV